MSGQNPLAPVIACPGCGKSVSILDAEAHLACIRATGETIAFVQRLAAAHREVMGWRIRVPVQFADLEGEA